MAKRTAYTSTTSHSSARTHVRVNAEVTRGRRSAADDELPRTIGRDMAASSHQSLRSDGDRRRRVPAQVMNHTGAAIRNVEQPCQADARGARVRLPIIP